MNKGRKSAKVSHVWTHDNTKAFDLEEWRALRRRSDCLWVQKRGRTWSCAFRVNVSRPCCLHKVIRCHHANSSPVVPTVRRVVEADVMQRMCSLFLIHEPTPPIHCHCESTDSPRLFMYCRFSFLQPIFVSFFFFLDISICGHCLVLCFRQCHLLCRVCPVRKLFNKCQIRSI